MDINLRKLNCIKFLLRLSRRVSNEERVIRGKILYCRERWVENYVLWTLSKTCGGTKRRSCRLSKCSRQLKWRSYMNFREMTKDGQGNIEIRFGGS